ncbi:hypothetical protein B1759_15140 [Rubrivirga sp. SAORIC476]|uniref:hypothetical protein n=1 Tax=Rubrivirga sp. SAORIC476 TaxID=1961794 RepID=UPI000BA8D64F|nr:hypothetical protein [Rubrivirga sp. SAORIC476]MAQ92893.1 hypothetical protein [Rhodothermaceae bacterium]MBC14351.1 hypothetical protein [Rhodothermaceae bacterium]PAP79652.1 hypothetical protein B1759_15140 [Rubrivirga sp. SAORIC476]
MQYPLTLSFKLLALSPQVRVTDATGAPVLFVHQKAFKLKEAVTVYRDDTRQTPLYTIGADRILDFNAAYQIRDGLGREVGTLARKGRRSIFRARYDILDPEGNSVFRVHEDSAMVKVLDSLLQQIPLVGAFAGYFFNPTYSVEADDPATPEREGAPVMTLAKQPAMWEGTFTLDRVGDLMMQHEEMVVVALLMMVLRERMRG